MLQKQTVCEGCGCIVPSSGEARQKFPHKCLIRDLQPLSLEQREEVYTIVTEIVKAFFMKQTEPVEINKRGRATISWEDDAHDD